MKLLTIKNHKTLKGESRGYLTGILYLDPRMKKVCPNATPGCKASCLFTAGRGAFSSVQNARKRKTEWFFNDRQGFMEQLILDIHALRKKADKLGLKPCVRLNGTSDIDWSQYTLPYLWDKFTVFQYFQNTVKFYDYTKRLEILIASESIPNYHVTFSQQEYTRYELPNTLNNPFFHYHKHNLAVVFKGDLPKVYMNRPVIDGDKDDLRFLDPKGVIVGLKAKGRARKDLTGFVVTT